MEQSVVSAVPERATQGTEGRDRKWWWVEASVWTERMVSALEKGVKGGKWFSLVDELTRSATLEAAWRKVARNKGSAGVDGQSTERFALTVGRPLHPMPGSSTARLTRLIYREVGRERHLSHPTLARYHCSTARQ